REVRLQGCRAFPESPVRLRTCGIARADWIQGEFFNTIGQNRSRASGAEFAQKLTFAVAPTRTKLEH
ncbi:hypothetical protein ACSFBX_34995, partial [Variovorax sp. RB2P76]|uniref:hypothetical protein n=1 Tax=Variovorax sp. RB2P76 TaxID=3443736 RepID=UPI003F46DD4E